METRTAPGPSRPFLVSAVLSAVPALVAVVAVLRFGVDVPYWDEWELVPLLERLHGDELGFRDLWMPHLEHRLLFPRALLLLLAVPTGWNVRLELMVLLAILGVVFLLAWRLLERTRRVVRPFSPPSWWIGPATSLLVFSLAQEQNLLWGWQVSVVLMVAAVLAGLGLLADAADRWSGLALAAGLGIVATGSFGSGLLFWPAGLVLVARPCSRRLPRIAAWVGISLVVGIVYLWGLDRAPFHPGRQGLDLVLHLGAYVGLWVGSPLLRDLPPQVALWGGTACAGAFPLLAAGLLVFDGHRARTARWLWVAVGGFALACGTLTSLGRVHLGIGQALSSRYTTISLLFWVAVLGLLLTLPPPRVRRPVAVGAGIVVAGLVVFATLAGAARMRDEASRREEARAALVAGRPASELGVLHPDPDVLAARIVALERLRMGPFRDRR